jgi:hypothetical protein
MVDIRPSIKIDGRRSTIDWSRVKFQVCLSNDDSAQCTFPELQRLEMRIGDLRQLRVALGDKSVAWRLSDVVRVCDY